MNELDDIFDVNKFRNNDKKVNYYNSLNDCTKYSYKTTKKRTQTNPKFKLFDQNYFTAGDKIDINKYALLPTRYVYSLELEDKKKVKKTIDKNYFKLYKNIDYISIKNTFDYLFYKFKKGIYVIIKDNKLFMYLPFSNANYKNNWVKQTYFSLDEKKLLEKNNYDNIKKILDNNILEFQKKYPEQFKFGRSIDLDRKKWYSNNCHFRNLFPRYEGELNTNIYKNLLETLVKERNIPDVEFFINDRDFPLLKKDFTEPYNHLYDGDDIKIEEKYHFDRMAPIFSKSITDKYADILIPTNDDWLKVSNHYFLDDCSNKLHNKEWSKINMDWDSKKSICIFRGSATGCGITIDNNMRLKSAHLSVQYPDILDSAITDWNARPKKYINQPIEIIDTSKFNFKLAEKKITNSEKSDYKYILNIDGFVSAFRLSSELSMNSVILIVKSEYKLWFSHLLVEYKHYIPIKSDLSDLIEQIQWCIANDKKCKKIAQNAVSFYNKYLTKDAILDYMQNKLNIIYSNKNFKNLLDIKKEKKNIAIISCFRDPGDGLREKQRKIFIQLMNKILKPYCNFHVYIIEQNDDGEKFNIGKLKNIGFKIANEEDKYDTFIFSDIDTIPDYDLMPYFLKKLDYPISLAIRGTRYEETDKKTDKIFTGALIRFDKNIFEKVNGYPNNMYGWGGEDDALLTRLIFNNIYHIYYPKVGSIIDIEEFKTGKTLTLGNKYRTADKEMIKYEKLYEDLSSWNKNGLNSLNYKELERTKINDNTTQIKVDLLKKSDEKKYPFLYNIVSNNYEKLINIIINRRKKLSEIYI
jgi:hypothetical protein